jgi:hypothetical protein
MKTKIKNAAKVILTKRNLLFLSAPFRSHGLTAIKATKGIKSRDAMRTMNPIGFAVKPSGVSILKYEKNGSISFEAMIWDFQ